MAENAWATVLRQIPPEQHNQLMLVTAAGTEIAVQTILQTYPDFIAFKGRLAGSQDAGRLYFLPYQNVDYLGFVREVKDEEFVQMFAALDFGVAAEAAPIPAEAPPPAEV